MDTNWHTSCLTKQHITTCQQLLCPTFTQGCCTVDTAACLERYTCWEIRFYHTGNGGCVWSLCRHNQVNSRCTCLLRNTLNTRFNLFTCQTHQICNLVNNNDNIRHIRQIYFLGFEQQFPSFFVCTNGDLLGQFFASRPLLCCNFIITFNISCIQNL